MTAFSKKSFSVPCSSGDVSPEEAARRWRATFGPPSLERLGAIVELEARERETVPVQETGVPGSGTRFDMEQIARDMQRVADANFQRIVADAEQVARFDHAEPAGHVLYAAGYARLPNLTEGQVSDQCIAEAGAEEEAATARVVALARVVAYCWEWPKICELRAALDCLDAHKAG